MEKFINLRRKTGEVFEDLRMDSFKVTDERRSGAGMVADYEIEYTQLRGIERRWGLLQRKLPVWL